MHTCRCTLVLVKLVRKCQLKCNSYLYVFTNFGTHPVACVLTIPRTLFATPSRLNWAFLLNRAHTHSYVYVSFCKTPRARDHLAKTCLPHTLLTDVHTRFIPRVIATWMWLSCSCHTHCVHAEYARALAHACFVLAMTKPPPPQKRGWIVGAPPIIQTGWAVSTDTTICFVKACPGILMPVITPLLRT